jgi:hypothetical protein
MKLFECRCGQPLYFENAVCESCGRRLGYVAESEILIPLESQGGIWRGPADMPGPYRFCANAEFGVCNWLISTDGPGFCLACRHNRTIPNLSQPDALALWRKIEIAKHRLFYTLLKLRLPHTLRPDDPRGLVFDFLASESEEPGASHVVTGHADGLITINLAEADDSKRELQRNKMREPYRTLLGHFRHEIAHYFWDRLIADQNRQEEFRVAFGDERESYADALSRHYADGPPADWPERFVTAYAGAHPWEDFAETWAHYLHMVDTLETAGAFGLRVKPKLAPEMLAAAVDFDPHAAELDQLVSAWLPLSFAVNSINRSMGMPDVYPFVLTPAVVLKLAFIHRIIRAKSGTESAPMLRAVAAALTKRVGATQAQ